MQFEQLYEQYRPMIFAVMRKLYIDNAREDFMQIGAIALWEASMEHDPQKGPFNVFVFMKIKYAMLQELRRFYKWSKHEQQEQFVEMTEPACEYAFENVILIQNLLLDLREDERIILTQYYENGLTHEEIGAILGKSAEAIKKKKQRILGRLRAKVFKTKELNIKA